jgi:hypothetical protein
MVKQDWMIVVAGEALVDLLTLETVARCRWTGRGYASDELCILQREQSARSIVGAEVIYFPGNPQTTLHPPKAPQCSVRYDSGLQDFGLLATTRSGTLNGTLEDGERWAREWVAQDPMRRYAWRRKTEVERAA